MLLDAALIAPDAMSSGVVAEATRSRLDGGFRREKGGGIGCLSIEAHHQHRVAPAKTTGSKLMRVESQSHTSVEQFRNQLAMGGRRVRIPGRPAWMARPETAGGNATLALRVWYHGRRGRIRWPDKANSKGGELALGRPAR